jgi:hypothetical protein
MAAFFVLVTPFFNFDKSKKISMAKINIPIKVNIPDNIEISLIRSDYHEFSNIFRVAFEIRLAVFSGFLGYFITLKAIDVTDIILIATLLSVITGSLIFWLNYQKKSIQHTVSDEPNEDILAGRTFHLAVNVKVGQQPKVENEPKMIIPGVRYDWYKNRFKTDSNTLRI